MLPASEPAREESRMVHCELVAKAGHCLILWLLPGGKELAGLVCSLEAMSSWIVFYFGVTSDSELFVHLVGCNLWVSRSSVRDLVE